MSASQVPFPFISDLPPRAQRELERDFFELQRQITPTPTVFDAVIDPHANGGVSSPSTHTYKNLTDLIANESWDNTYTFNVGVHQPGAFNDGTNTRIIEPNYLTTPLNISSKGNL